MFIFYLLTTLAALPIIAYVLAQKTINKGLIFGSSLLILSLCLFMFISKFAFVGSFEKQTLNPGEKASYTLVFYLDPELVNDPKTSRVEDVTMSYTFFSSEYYKNEKKES